MPVDKIGRIHDVCKIMQLTEQNHFVIDINEITVDIWYSMAVRSKRFVTYCNCTTQAPKLCYWIWNIYDVAGAPIEMQTNDRCICWLQSSAPMKSILRLIWEANHAWTVNTI